MISKFDIFRRLPDGGPLWIKAVESLEEAKRQLSEISEARPGEYFVFDTNRSLVIYPHRAAT